MYNVLVLLITLSCCESWRVRFVLWGCGIAFILVMKMDCVVMVGFGCEEVLSVAWMR